MVDVEINKLENILWLQRATTDEGSGLVVGLKFLGLFLAKNIAWSSG